MIVLFVMLGRQIRSYRRSVIGALCGIYICVFFIFGTWVICFIVICSVLLATLSTLLSIVNVFNKQIELLCLMSLSFTC